MVIPKGIIFISFDEICSLVKSQVVSHEIAIFIFITPILSMLRLDYITKELYYKIVNCV